MSRSKFLGRFEICFLEWQRIHVAKFSPKINKRVSESLSVVFADLGVLGKRPYDDSRDRV